MDHKIKLKPRQYCIICGYKNNNLVIEYKCVETRLEFFYKYLIRQLEKPNYKNVVINFGLSRDKEKKVINIKDITNISYNELCYKLPKNDI